MFGVELTMDKNDVAAIATDREFAQFIIGLIEDLLATVLDAPVQTIVNLIPRLSYFIASNGLAQAVEQLLAPVLTLVNMVNEVASAELNVDGTTVKALDVYEFLGDLLKGLGILAEDATVTKVTDITGAILTEAGLIALIDGLVNKDKTAEDEGYIDFAFLDGIFTEIVNNTAVVGDVDTVREFGAVNGKVEGVQLENATVLVGLISDMILAEGGLIFEILDLAGLDLEAEENATVAGIIEDITGDNRYKVLEVLLNYFNHYEVENDAIEFLEFKGESYDYDSYTDGSTLTSRKVRRAIKKLDQAILAVIPDLLPMLEEVAFLEGALSKVKKADGTYKGVTLDQVVDALLNDLLFKDEMMDTIVGAVIGAIGTGSLADTLATILPILDELLDINFTPAEVATNAAGTTLETFLTAAINAADLTNEDGTTRDATWADVAAYYTENVYYYVDTVVTEDDPATEEDEAKTEYVVKSFTSKEVYEDAKEDTFTIDGVEYTATVYAYQIEADEADGTVSYKLTEDENAEKIAAGTKVVVDYNWGITGAESFIEVLWAFVAELEPVLNFLFRGESIAITSDNGTALEIKGGKGYEFAILPLFRGLAVDQFSTLTTAEEYMNAEGTSVTLTAITDGIFAIVDAIAAGPLEYILSLVPSLAYLIESDGVEKFITNLLAPVFALLDVADPVVGTLIDDLLGGLLSGLVGDFMPADVVGTPATNDDGEEYTKYTLDQIIENIATSENIVNIINNLVGGLIFTDKETGEAIEAAQLLPNDFFEQYVKYAVEIGELNGKKNYLEAKVLKAGGAFGGEAGETVIIASTDFDKKIDGEYYELTGATRGIVDSFTVDIADSLVFLLTNVLSADLLNALLPADQRVDENGDANLVGTIINNILALIEDGNAGLTLVEVIVALFEGYEVSYSEYKNDLELDFNNNRVDSTGLPAKLDTIINEALPLVLELLVTETPEDGSLLDLILDALNDENANDETRIKNIVDALINGFVIEGDLDIMNLIVNTVVDLLGGTEIIDTVLDIIVIGGKKLTPDDYLASIKAHFGTNAKYATAVAAMDAIIGDATTWAQVKANAAKDAEGKCAIEAEWGVTSLETLIDAIMVLAQPLTPVLQVLFQGKTITLLSSGTDEEGNVIYSGDFDTAVPGATDNDDRSEEIASGVILGDGYIEIRGSKGYEQGILALVDALDLTVEGLPTAEAYNASSDITVILGSVLDIVLALVDGIAAGPVEFIAEHLAGLLYFVAADNLSVLVDNIIALVWGLLAVVEPITGETDAFIESLLGVNLDNYITIDGLLGLINGLIEANKDFELTAVEDEEGNVTGYTYVNGEETVEVALDAEGIKEADGKKYITVKTGTLDLVITVDMLKSLIEEIGEEKATIGISKTPVTGSEKYFVSGLLTFAIDEILPIFATENEEDIINQVITYLGKPGAVAGVVEFLNKLTTKYVVEFAAIADPATALTKIAVDYESATGHTVTKAQTTTALDNLDALIAELLPMLGLLEEGETLADLIVGLLLTDEMVNTIVGLLAGIFGGLNDDIMNIINIVADALGEEIDISVATYKQDADIAGFFGDATTWAEVVELYTAEDAEEATYDYEWKLDECTTNDAKIEKFVAILTSFLAPLDFVLEVLLAGGTVTGDAADADSISAFKEINIMGGSGYNYAIIPLLEALGVPNVKTQAEYEATFEAQGTLGYILETVLKYVVNGLEAGKPVEFVLNIIANLAYTISKDGLTTIVGNLIAPVSALLKSLENVLPISVVIDLKGAITGGTVVEFKMGDDAKNKVGLILDLNDETLEDLIDAVIAKFAADLGLDLSKFSFAALAAGSAATDANGNIIFTDSKVSDAYDNLNGTWGKNISGDKADTLITLLDMILTTENIEAVLALVLKDQDIHDVINGLLDGKLAVLNDVIDNAIANPKVLVDTIIKVLSASGYTVEDIKVLFDAIATEDYTFNTAESGIDATRVDLALNKLDAILNNAINPVVGMLGDMDGMPELIADLAAANPADIKAVVDYFLETYALTDDIVNMIIGALVDIFGGMDEETFNTINDLLGEILEISISLDAFTADSTYLAAFAGEAADWAALKAQYTVTEGEETKTVITYDQWFAGAEGTDAKLERLIDIALEIVAPFAKVLDFLFRGEDVEILIDGIKLQGGNGWDNVIVPLGKALGINLAVAENATAVDCVEALLKGIVLGENSLVGRIAESPINTIVEVVIGLSYFIASDGVEEAVWGILAPITGFLGLLDAIIGMDDINELLTGLIGMNLNDIADIAGDKGEKLIDMINELIGSVEIVDKDTEIASTFNLLPRDFFEKIAAYGIDYTATKTLAEGEVGYDYQHDQKYVENFTFNRAEALMYVLETVCSEDFLKTLATKIGKDVNSPDLIANIILGLAGKQENIVDILLTLLTEYEVTYSAYNRNPIDKIEVEYPEQMQKENLEAALAALDPIINAVIPMLLKNEDGTPVESLKAFLTGMLADLDIADLLMELLVPVLANLGDIDEILGYVNTLTSLEISLDPQTFANAANESMVDEFIGDAQTWAEVLDTRFTKTVAEDGSDKYEINEFEWNLGLENGFDGLITFVCDLLAPLDPVLELLLVGATLKVIPDTNDADGIDEIEIVGGKGYNYAIIPLLEALGVEALSEADYIAAADEAGSYLKPVLTALIAKVDTLLAAPISTLIPMLANIFYFVGTNGINNIAENLLAFANYLLVKIDPVFHIGVSIDLSAAKILDYELGEGNRLDPGVKINVNPADLIDLVNGLLDGIEVNGAPLGISLDIDWLDIAAKMAVAEKAYTAQINGITLNFFFGDDEVTVAEDGTVTTKINLNGTLTDVELTPVEDAEPIVRQIPTVQVKADGDTATWYNIVGDPADTFATLLEVILSDANTYAIADLVSGLLGTALDGMDGKDAEGNEDASELNLKGLLEDILYNPNGIRNLIYAVVQLISGGYDIVDNAVIFKFLGVLTYFAGEDAENATSLNTAISKLDAIITREAPALIAMFVPEDAEGILGSLRTAAAESANLSEMVDKLLGELLLTEANFDAIIGAIVKAIGGFLTADLCGTLKDLLGIDLAPAAFAATTENADVIAYVGAATTWADVWAAHSDAEGKHIAYNWTTIYAEDVISVESFVGALADLLKPLNSILDFILADGAITLIPTEDGAAITLPGGNAYNTAIVPLFKALGVDLATADSSSEAIKALVNGLISRNGDEAVGLVSKISDAPIKTILELVAGLSYLLANDNLEPIIKNLLAPVFSILDLLEGVVSRDQIDNMLKKFLVIDGKAYGLTDLIEIGNNGGANLVGLLNGLIGGLKIYAEDAYNEDGSLKEGAEPVDVLTLLPADFFTELSKYAVDVTTPAAPAVGEIADAWTYDAAETLMYILDTVLSDTFMAVLADMLGADSTVESILTGLVDKEMNIVELILMLLDNYTLTYNKIPQADLDETVVIDYDEIFEDNADDVKASLPSAIEALDDLVPVVLGFIEINGTNYASLGELVNGLLANADLGKVLMELLVPVLADLGSIDAILGYVNTLTNLELALDPQTFATSAIHGSKLADFIGEAETWADVLAARFTKTTAEDGSDKYVMNEYDFGLATLDDIVKFASDLLMPLDVVFQILFSGADIIALPDETNAGNEIKINGGYGYNYALVPLLEALGATPISAAEYEAKAATEGSLKPILDVIVARVNEILDAPISNVLGLVANLFYFIGSEGINTVVTNLVAPVTNLLDAVCDVYPISIKVAIENGEFVFAFDLKNELGLNPGLTFDISADALSDLIGGLLAGIEINGEALGLTLDLDWNALAAAMAKRDAEGNIIYTNSAMVYDYKDATAIGNGNDPYKNISGEAADALVAILTAVLTEENTAVIKELVLGLLGDAELDPALQGLINKVLGDGDGIINLIGAVVLVLTGEYEIDVLDFVFYVLGDKDYNVENADKAIDALDRLIGKAVPVVLPLIAGEQEEGSLLDKISDAAANVPENTAVLTHIINTLLGEFVFTQDMMNTVTDLVVGTLGGILSESLCGTINDLLGIDLSPAGFVAAADNAQLTAYIGDAKTWAEVQDAHIAEDGTIDAIFTGVDTKDEFLNNVFDLLQVAEPVLALLLTGDALTISAGNLIEGANAQAQSAEIKILGNDGYNNAIKYLFQGLGLDQMGATWKALGTDDDAVDALRYTVDYVLALVDTLGAAPVDTILVLVANLSYLIANDGVEVILTNLVSPVLSLVNALEGTINRAELDALIETLVNVDLLGKPLNITNILTIAGNNGKVLVDLINDLLKPIVIYDQNGEPTVVIKALPDTFFVDLAKAAIEVDASYAEVDEDNVATGEDIATKWHVDTGDALMYILETVLSTDFLQILCQALNIQAADEEGNQNMVYGIITSLANKEEELLDVLLNLLVKYLVEYTAFKQPTVDKVAVVKTESKGQFESVVTNLDALIPTVLGLLGVEGGNLKSLVEGLVADADLGKVVMELLVPILAGLPAETIDMVLGYVAELTSLTDLDISPAAFANDNFGSQMKNFIGNAETWADVLDARFTETTDEEGNVKYVMNEFDFAIESLDDLVAFVCDLTAPLDCILALLLQGGQVAAGFNGTTTGKALSILDEVNVMGGMGYNYAIIPLLELLGIDAMSQDAYDAAVTANYGSTLYPILSQLIDKVAGKGGILENPISWLADILANLCYVLATDGITTIVDNLLAPVNMLIAKVDKLFPIAIDINIGDINGGDGEVVSLYIGEIRPANIQAGIHVRVSGEALTELLNSLVAGLSLEINGQKIELIGEDGLALNWIELAGKAGRDADGDGKVDFNDTAFSTKFDIYNGTAYKTLDADAADTFMTVLNVVLESVDVQALLDALGLDSTIKGFIEDILEDPTKIVDAITDLFSNKATYQPVQNRPVDMSKPGMDYSTYLTFTEENADIIASNIDQLIVDILDAAGLGSIESIVSDLINDALVNNLLDTIFGLLASDSVAGILNTVKGLEFHVLGSTTEELTDDNRLVIDLTVLGFRDKLAPLVASHPNLAPFVDRLNAAIEAKGEEATWADVGSMAGINWGIDSAANLGGKLDALAAAFAGVLTPLNGVLELLLIGEGKFLNVLGLVNIAGGDGYDYAIIPLLEALGLSSTEVKTENEYKKAVAADETKLLGYILEEVVYFAKGLLDKPVDSLLGILPNLAYFFSNDGLLLTVKNLLAPVYGILDLVLPLLGIKLESYLRLEELVANIDLGKLVFQSDEYHLYLPKLDWMSLVVEGASGATEVSTSRSNPNNAPYAETWANSFKKNMTADEYAAYAAANDITDASLFKNTQKRINADKGDTLTWIFNYIFSVFEVPENKETLIKWIVNFFELQSGAEQTVRYAVNELFNQAAIYNSSDIVVSALFYLLGAGVVIDAALMGNVKTIQGIFDQLFGAMGSNSGCAYSSIAKIMQELTGVWDDTIGSDDDHQDAVEEGEETLNWFQRLIQKIKEFFQKIFSIFK